MESLAERDATAVTKRHDAAWAKATTVEMPPELGGLRALQTLDLSYTGIDGT